MIKKMNKPFSLIKINIKNSFQNPYLFDKETGKINKKSIFFWLILIFMFFLTYISFEIIKVLVEINQPTIFLNLFLLFLFIIMIFQLLLASSNVYFFSKDFENLLPLPLKPKELLISKFSTLLLNMYFTEVIFALFPLIIYGILASFGILYYLMLFIILLVFPLLPILIVSIITMFFIKLFKFIKKPETLQLIIIAIFIVIFSIISFKIISKIISNPEIKIEETDIMESISGFNKKMWDINNYFLVINPIVKILNNQNIIINLFRIFITNIIFFILFIFIGNKYYLKSILKNNSVYIKKYNKNYNDRNFRKINKNKAYIKKELKLIMNNPIYFIQCVIPSIIIIFAVLLVIFLALPNIKAFIEAELTGDSFSLDLGIICLVLGLIQIIMTLSNISITAISREGKSAYYMKCLPIGFYKQYIYKTIPQIILNLVLIFIILIFIKLVFPIFNLLNLILIFIIANLINILNSNLMVLVDLYKPNLNWNEYYEAISQNNNKLFQYVLTILIILILVYFNKIFLDIELNIACVLIIIILILFILIVNKIINVNIKRLYKNVK